ncbi:hypothetical protein [Massilia sp. YMA4]|uniref:hypothetical protein n=1 Tax=Massilia sp. YMA4 TaxID=1593482 RepID=UPI000DD13EE4|nr:hypothetical protein [Massilia sp. YMA4]AXA90450.1 hypothetical protein DPH57_04255 [Massilia sp. YMA4]
MTDKLVELIISCFSGNQIIAIAVVGIALLSHRLKAVLEFAEHHSRRGERFIKESLSIAVLGDVERTMLIEDLNRLIVRAATGLDASREMRSQIMRLIELSKGDLQLRTFVRARQFLFMEHGMLTVKIDLASQVEFLAAGITSAISFAMAAASFVAAVAIRPMEPLQIALCVGTAFIMTAVGVMMLFGRLAMLAGRRLDRFIQTMPSEPRTTG